MILVLIILIIIILTILWLSYNSKYKIYSQSESSIKEKLIALTFDDGPNPGSTKEILNILKENSIKATFFVVGKNIQRYPDLLKKIDADGHLIGNHSHLHRYRTLVASPTSVLKDLELTTAAINNVIHRMPIFYRPPFGLRTPWGVRVIHNSGYIIVTWNNMTYDYLGLAANRLVSSIVKNSKPGGIIVLHDGGEGFARSGFSNVLTALPIIIQNLKKEGYRFVRLDELFGVSGYR